MVSPPQVAGGAFGQPRQRALADQSCDRRRPQQSAT